MSLDGREEPIRSLTRGDYFGEQALLKALGGAMAIEAYTAAGYIGALADGFQAKTYTAQYVKVRLGGGSELRHGAAGKSSSLISDL